jgi:GNAT superfamily N-acetyltransferase
VSTAIDVAELDASAVRAAIDELADVLVDCVEGGASVSFMAPYTREQGIGFFRGIAAAIERREVVLLAGRTNGRIVGTVQLGIRTPPNQPHRADVMKLLVRRDARKQGIGAALMRRLEAAASERGRKRCCRTPLRTDGMDARRHHPGLRLAAARRILRHDAVLETRLIRAFARCAGGNERARRRERRRAPSGYVLHPYRLGAAGLPR